MTTSIHNNRRHLTWWEIQQLERQGCNAEDWNRVTVADSDSLKLMKRISFEGDVSVGKLSADSGRKEGIYSATIIDCRLGDHVLIKNVPGYIKGIEVGDEVVIDNVYKIELQPEVTCGVGTEVCVLDETGSRAVRIYPGMSAQSALLIARNPRWSEGHFLQLLEEDMEKKYHTAMVGERSKIENVGTILNVNIGKEVTIEGASRLVNGSIVNNAGKDKCMAYIGVDVDMENFIVEDGVVSGGSYVRNCYIGQGAVLDKRFTAHDSLFFANCSLENGEACAVFAGPYTVSMHKSTLLIGCQTSFMNAGSNTNQSNHMYKLGPIHWGIMERGVKTASGSYIMWGAHLGAFSLLMGVHKNHPDTSDFPFSYIFGDETGSTTVVPAMMLRNCGLVRDETKWPTRDRRLKRKLHFNDRINFPILNPYTVDQMVKAVELIELLLNKAPDEDRYIRHKGMKFRSSSLERAHKLYKMAIYKYLYERIGDKDFPEANGDADQWVDLAGQVVSRSVVNAVCNAESISEMEKILDSAANRYSTDELQWIGNRFGEEWRKGMSDAKEQAAAFEKMVEEDRTSYREMLSSEMQMLSL
jgi:hypothetical protein